MGVSDLPLQLRAITAGDRPVVERLWQLYRHDLSEFRHHMGPDASGQFQARHLPQWFEPDDADRIGYLALAEDDVHGLAPVGFALLYGLARPPVHMAEFFVVRMVRRRGVGAALATQVLRRHPGPWVVAFQEENPEAARFWRRLLPTLAGADGVTQTRRPVPGKPHLPPDTWVDLVVP